MVHNRQPQAATRNPMRQVLLIIDVQPCSRRGEGGARALCLLWGFSKVSRCKSGTISGRYGKNGYVHQPTNQPTQPNPIIDHPPRTA